jgi:hypothetical protein
MMILLTAIVGIFMTSCAGLQPGCQANNGGYNSGYGDSKGGLAPPDQQQLSCGAQAGSFGANLMAMFGANVNLSSSVSSGCSGGQQSVIIGGSCPQGRQVYQQRQVIQQQVAYQGGARYERYNNGYRQSNNGGYQRCQPTKQYPQGYRPCPPSPPCHNGGGYNTGGWSNVVVGQHQNQGGNCNNGHNTGGWTNVVNNGQGRHPNQGGNGNCNGGYNTGGWTNVVNNGRGRVQTPGCRQNQNQGGGGRNVTNVVNNGQGRNRRR